MIDSIRLKAKVLDHRPLFQALKAPIELIYALFMQSVGYLLLFFGAKEWGNTLILRGKKIESRCSGCLLGLYAYGQRFLVSADNYEESCRGSCYWMIDQHLSSPDTSLVELAQQFEGGAPLAAVAIHRAHQIPDQLEETQVWRHITDGHWPPMPELEPGIYTFLVGHSSRDDTHGKGHRFALFKEGSALLFDPNTGLSEWVVEDWAPLLERIAADIRSSEDGYFTIECYRHHTPAEKK